MTTFIDDEREFFAPILEAKTSSEALQVYRQETVSDRRLRISKEVFDIFGGVVAYGLFGGLRLSQASIWWGAQDVGAQVLGIYEKEVADLISELGPRTSFISIGAADGYYAIGMLCSGMAQRCHAFEISERGRETILNNWRLNSEPGELFVHGTADAGTISQVPVADLLDCTVVIDIEGAEFSFLSDSILHRLSKCDIILEIHSWVDGFFEQYRELIDRASLEFDVSVINRVTRNTVDIPELRHFTDDNRALITSEGRPCLQRFLHLAPKNG